MEESYHHHHHHHHHHGHQNDGPAESIFSDQQAETISQTSDEVQTITAPITVPGANTLTVDGIQTAGSFHSVSSIDSSAEMAKYFPEAPTANLSLSNRQQQQHVEVTNTSSYATVPAVQPQLSQAAVRFAQQQHALRAPAAPQLPPGIPSYLSPIEGLSVSQTIVNDVIIDLQSKVINEAQQQYYDGLSSGNYFEPLSPIYIRAPNPTIILRSDLHRLRAQLNARPAPRHPGNINQFQVPSFPPP